MPAVLFQNCTDMSFSHFSFLEANPDHADNVIELCRFRSVFFLFHLRGNKSKFFTNLCDNLRIDGSEHFFHFCKALCVAAFHADEESALYLTDIDHFQFLAAPSRHDKTVQVFGCIYHISYNRAGSFPAPLP